MIRIERRAFLWTGQSFVSMLFIDSGIHWTKYLLPAFAKLESEATAVFPEGSIISSFVWTQQRICMFSPDVKFDDLCIECTVEIKHDTNHLPQHLPQHLREDVAEKLMRWAQQKDDDLGFPAPTVGLPTPKYIYKDRVYPDAFL